MRKPTGAQQHWLEWLAQQGCAVCGATTSIHHPVGRTGRHNKVDVGCWWINNFCHHHHQSPGGIHGDLSAFDIHDIQRWGETRKQIEKSIFAYYVAGYETETGRQIPDDVKRAIKDYHR